MSEADDPDQAPCDPPVAGRRRSAVGGTAARGDDASDEQLAAGARAGDDRCLETLLRRYRGFAHAKSRAYFLVGGDPEDIRQEAMIGLYKAIREYNPGLHASFRTFAEVCVARQVITAVRTATRRKHGPLNSYFSFHLPVAGDVDGGATLADVLPGAMLSDPAEQVISAERIRSLQRHVDGVLSDLEAQVLWHYVDGRGYQEIARMLKRHTKTVDNALQRVKRKVDLHLAAWDAEIA